MTNKAPLSAFSKASSISFSVKKEILAANEIYGEDFCKRLGKALKFAAYKIENLVIVVVDANGYGFKFPEIEEATRLPNGYVFYAGNLGPGITELKVSLLPAEDFAKQPWATGYGAQYHDTEKQIADFVFQEGEKQLGLLGSVQLPTVEAEYGYQKGCHDKIYAVFVAAKDWQRLPLPEKTRGGFTVIPLRDNQGCVLTMLW